MVKNSRKYGKVRAKLATLLEQEVPGLTVDPSELHTQHPVYIKYYGCCVWYGFGRTENGWDISIHSFDTMTDCARYGISIEQESPREYEIHSKKGSGISAALAQAEGGE